MSFSDLDVIGFFLFVAGLLYMLLSGRIRDMFRDRAPKPILAIVFVIGLAIYHWGSIFAAPPVSPEPSAPQPSAAVPEPPPDPLPKPINHPVKARSPAVASTGVKAPAPNPQTIEHWTVIQQDPPAQVFGPPAPVAAPAIPLSSEPDPYESKAKRGLHAIGRFLHIQKKTQP